MGLVYEKRKNDEEALATLDAEGEGIELRIPDGGGRRTVEDVICDVQAIAISLCRPGSTRRDKALALKALELEAKLSGHLDAAGAPAPPQPVALDAMPPRQRRARLLVVRNKIDRELAEIPEEQEEET